MSARASTPGSAAWLLAIVGCCSCATPSSFDPVALLPDHDGSASDMAIGGVGGTHGNGNDASVTTTTIDMAQPIITPMTGPDMTMLDLGPFPPGDVYQISSKVTGQLISIHGAATVNGSITEEQPAHAAGDQRWSLTSVGGGAYQLVNLLSGDCLDVNGASTADGATTWIWACDEATSQQWKLMTTSDGYYNLVNGNSGSCIDLDNSGTSPGTVIFQYKCNGGDNQKWFFTRVY